MLAPLVAAGEVSASINAPDEVALDSDFTAILDIGEVVDLNAVQYDISFDPSVLRLDGMTTGRIDSTEMPVQFNEISPDTYRVVQSMGLGTVSGSGYLAVLHFHVIGSPGQISTIDLSSGLLSGMEGEIPATWIGDSVNVISVKSSGQESPMTPVSPPETATAEPGVESSKEELLPATSQPPETTNLPEVEGAGEELLPMTSSLNKAEAGDVSSLAPPAPPSPPTQTYHVNQPVLWRVIGGIAIVIGLIVFLQVRKRLDMR